LSRIVSISTLVVAVAIAGYGWYRVLALELPGEVRWVEWRDAAPCKNHIDSHLDALIDGDRLIVPCDDTYADIALRDGTAHVWPHEPPTPRESTVAIASGPRGELLIAWAWHDDEMIAARVEGGRTILLGPGSVLAAVWVDGAFEVVQASPNHNEAAVTRLDRNKSSRRGLRMCDYCIAVGAYHTADHGWALMVDEYWRRQQTRVIAERGWIEPVEPGPVEYVKELFEVDRVSLGVIDRVSERALGRDGIVRRVDDRPPGYWSSTSRRTLRRVGNEVERQREWYDETGPTVAQQTTAGLRFTAPTQDDVLVGPAPYALHVVTRWADCKLWSAEWVPTRDGAVLVSTDGCYLELDEALEPRERVSLVDHVATEGSRHRAHTTPRAVWRLGFVLFGLLGCTGVFGVLAAVSRTRIATAIVIGSAIYAVVAASLLPGLLALL
jgi:hypothetical protein